MDVAKSITQCDRRNPCAWRIVNTLSLALVTFLPGEVLFSTQLQVISILKRRSLTACLLTAQASSTENGQYSKSWEL
jgi:hypothetical protein